MLSSTALSDGQAWNEISRSRSIHLGSFALSFLSFFSQPAYFQGGYPRVAPTVVSEKLRLSIDLFERLSGSRSGKRRWALDHLLCCAPRQSLGTHLPDRKPVRSRLAGPPKLDLRARPPCSPCLRGEPASSAVKNRSVRTPPRSRYSARICAHSPGRTRGPRRYVAPLLRDRPCCHR